MKSGLEHQRGPGQPSKGSGTKRLKQVAKTSEHKPVSVWLIAASRASSTQLGNAQIRPVEHAIERVERAWSSSSGAYLP